jgi:hypothetical protein
VSLVTPGTLYPLDAARTTSARAKAKAAPAPAAEPAKAVHVVGEQIFKSVLVREGKRADRSGKGFMLLLVELDGDDSSPVWRHVIAALSAAKRETDIVGWLEQGRVIGVILTETAAAVASARQAVGDRVRGELAKRLDAAAMSGISIHIHFHSAPHVLREDGAASEELPVAVRSGRAHLLTAVAKRALDIVGSTALLFVLSPLLVGISILIKLTSAGPIFFRQTRVGQRAQLFTLLPKKSNGMIRWSLHNTPSYLVILSKKIISSSAQLE